MKRLNTNERFFGRGAAAAVLLCLALAAPSVCSAAGKDGQALPEIPAQIVEDAGGENGSRDAAAADEAKAISNEKFSEWIAAVLGGELSTEQLETLKAAVQAALEKETRTENGRDEAAETETAAKQEEPAAAAESAAEPLPAEQGGTAAGTPAGNDGAGAPAAAGTAPAAVTPAEEPKTDPRELSQYAGMTFTELLKLLPDAVSHGTVVGVKGFSLGGENQEAGLSGNESDEIITKVNLYGGSKYSLFGISYGMALPQAAAAAESAGFVNKSSEGGLLVYEAGGTGPAKEGSQLTVYSTDGETVNTVTYDIVPGKYF